MFNFCKSIKNPESNFRLFLDLPFRYGLENIKAGLSSNVCNPSKVANIVLIDPDSPRLRERLLTLRNRVVLLAVGLFELIPVVGIVVAVAEKRFKSRINFHPLISSQKPIPAHYYHWYQNLALLKSAHKIAIGADKKKIEFLAANFLNKVTPKALSRWVSELEGINPEFKTAHIGSCIDEYSYHRENIDHHYLYGKKFNNELAYKDQSLFVLTDTVEFELLFPILFDVINKKESKESYANILYNHLLKHFDEFPEEGFNKNFSRPLIVDTTNILNESIHVKGKKSKDKLFKSCYEKFKTEFESAQNQAIERLIKLRPTLAQHKSLILKRLQQNTSCINRVKTEKFSGIKFLPLGCYNSSKEQLNSPLISFHKNDDRWVNFITSTGIYINAINLRRTISNVFDQCPDIEYKLDKSLANSKLSTLYYPSKQAFMNTALFQRSLALYQSDKEIDQTNSVRYGTSCCNLEENINLIRKRPHMGVMGKLTLDLVRGFINELNENQWREIHENSVFLQVFQTSLFLIQHHMANAERSAISNDFNEFMKSIELIHAELSTLLELTYPFKKEDFNQIYKKELLGKSVPLNLESHTNCGLGKSATNVFAGVMSAAIPKDGVLQSVVGSDSYYEHTVLSHINFDAFMKNPAAKKANLYHAQFHPNVDVGSSPVTYKRKDIAADVRRMLSEEKVADNFTVAIDLTIDDFYSEATKDLLNQFQEEISSGKINFVLFASGQKFYNVGMDHYYAAPFYIVNNQDKKWDSFKNLFSDALLTPDDLSLQWFNLVMKYAADGLNSYRGLIFNNTKEILRRIPESLMYDSTKNQTLRVNGIDESMKPPFVDLKVMAPKSEQESESNKIKKSFKQMLIKEKMEACTRGSFGFFHCNFAVFGELDDHARTIRINPGINPDEVDKIVAFFKDLSTNEIQK